MNTIFSAIAKILPSLGRLLFTLTIITVATIIAWQLWVYYEVDPRTRDGAVRADTIGVAPDVSGRVLEVAVQDGAVVKKGQLLFKLNTDRAELALRQKEAALAIARTVSDQADREATRMHGLAKAGTITAQQLEQVVSAADQARATVERAAAEVDLAKLNIKEATVTAPSNGIITNLSLRPGTYVDAGEAVLALVDTNTIHVVGYFEETKIPKIQVGDRARIQLMGTNTTLHGHVVSIAAAINDQERTTGSNLLPDVNPNFSWIRLAQRIPVRIELDTVTSDIPLVAGRTASVEIVPSTNEQ